MDGQLAWIVPIAVVVPILLLIGWQFVREKNLQNGLYVWERRALYAHGAVAQGEVINLVELGTVRGGRISAYLTELVVDVRPERGAPWRASMHYLLLMMEQDRVRCGSIVPLRYDAANPKRLVIDWPTMDRRDAQEKHAAKEAALAERRALLAKGPDERRLP